MEVLSIVTNLLTGMGLSLLVSLIGLRFRKKKKNQTMEERVNSLTVSLKESTILIEQIQNEIYSKQQLVNKLQNDLDTYNKISELKKSEVEAVALLLRGELKNEGRKSFWYSALLNFIFFAFGVIATLVINKLTT